MQNALPHLEQLLAKLRFLLGLKFTRTARTNNAMAVMENRFRKLGNKLPFFFSKR
jgi:hypothetical protein